MAPFYMAPQDDVSPVMGVFFLRFGFESHPKKPDPNNVWSLFHISPTLRYDVILEHTGVGWLEKVPGLFLFYPSDLREEFD